MEPKDIDFTREQDAERIAEQLAEEAMFSSGED